ncbi:hypothetical protein FE257_002481 [Aspergillus nanangensis]|uniref:Uncharacterized protein n=1 Tax=Aspergillus nanangensis TaxID=2582783 RepID=A0AAD4GWV6_ASPNN|nr:hypothetical protein FE257_002481 [Aspergillus nanangensis]
MTTPPSLQVEITPPVLPPISQSWTSIPVQVSLHNALDVPLTVLNWGTPLDPRANILGIFHIRDTADDTLVALDEIKFSRALPPSEEDLVEVPAGGSVDTVVTLPRVPLVAGREYSIQAQGMCHGLWEDSREAVAATQLAEILSNKALLSF